MDVAQDFSPALPARPVCWPRQTTRQPDALLRTLNPAQSVCTLRKPAAPLASLIASTNLSRCRKPPNSGRGAKLTRTRTNLHFTLKQSPIQRKDFDEFVACYRPGRIHDRVPTWSEANPEGRWRGYDYEELLKRDKLSLDLFWIKDKSLTDTDSLPAPDVIAAEIADDLEAALAQFTKIAARLSKNRERLDGE